MFECGMNESIDVPVADAVVANVPVRGSVTRCSARSPDLKMMNWMRSLIMLIWN